MVVCCLKLKRKEKIFGCFNFVSADRFRESRDLLKVSGLVSNNNNSLFYVEHQV